MTTTYDAKRARDILEKAQEVGMYPDPLPDDDGKLIAEAERAVLLAQQAHHVAEEAGKDKVPAYDKIMEVLFIAEVVGGTSSADTLPEATEEASVSEDLPAIEPEPKADPVPDVSGGPVKGERWCDEDGLVWVVEGHLDGGDLEARMDGDKEMTSVPRDFLKKKVDGPAAPQEIKAKKEESSIASQHLEGSSSSSSSSQQESTPAPSDSDGGSVGSSKESSGGPPSSGSSHSSQQSASSRASDDLAYKDLLLRVQADYEREGLPLPADVPSPPQMPRDITVNESENRRLHSEFNACAARARYLLGLERQIKIGCQRLQKEHLKGPMRRARADLGAKATATEVTMTAEEDELVTAWRRRAEQHSDLEAAYKDLFEIYTQNVAVLSRDHTMSGKEVTGRA